MRQILRVHFQQARQGTTFESLSEHQKLLHFMCEASKSMQAIDAGYGWSMRCAIGHLFDKWLVDEQNMALWEDDAGMVPGYQQVLISTLVAQANEELLKNDKMRIGCFERAGMLTS
jgi:hypothetical protein